MSKVNVMNYKSMTYKWGVLQHKKQKLILILFRFDLYFDSFQSFVNGSLLVFSQLNNLDPELKQLFDTCGISEAQLKDKEISEIICDFIEKRGGVEAIKKELQQGESKSLGAATRLW